MPLQGGEPLVAVGVIAQRHRGDAAPGRAIERGRVGAVAQHQHHAGGRVGPQGPQQRFEVAAASGDGHGYVHRHGGRK
jgi:hypothetical protein